MACLFGSSVYLHVLFLLSLLSSRTITALEGELGYFHSTSGYEFYLRTPRAQIIGLRFPDGKPFYNDPTRLMNWQVVNVKGNHTNPQMIQVDSIYPTQLRNSWGERHSPYGRRMRTITFHFNSICGRYSDMTLGDIKYRYFNDNSRYRSFKNYFAECSKGRASFSQQDNRIIPIIDFPCFGTSKSGYKFNMNKCDMEEMYSLAEYVEEYAVQKGIDMSLYKNRIILLPTGTPCWWAGLATIGCSGVCYVWTIMSKNMPLTVFMHELGHNNGLMHSNLPAKEYGDSSCTMGVSPQVCFNAAQSWRLGWSDPIKILYIDKGIGSNSYIIPCSTNNTKNFLLMINGQTSYTLSYRCNFGKYEANLADFNKKISVHFTSTDQSQSSPTVLLAVLDLNQITHIPNTNIIIKFIQRLPDAAKVYVG